MAAVDKQAAAGGSTMPVMNSTTASTNTHWPVSDRAASISPSSTLAITARVRAMKADGRDVIGFGAGEPDFATPDLVCQTAIDAISDGMTHYVPVPGTPAAREAVAEQFRVANGIECTSNDIIISNGGKCSLYLALQALVNEGDEVILPVPAWVSYKPMVQLAGGRLVEVQTTAQNHFLASAESIDAAITDHTRVVILNSPSNPCGTMYSPSQIASICDVIARHEHITLISDEIYDQLVYGGHVHCSPGSLESMRDRTVTINGLSKTFAATGWRIGWTCAPGSGGAIVKAMSKLQSQMTSSVTSFTLPAVEVALRDGWDEAARMHDIFEKRAHQMYDYVSAWPGITCSEPMGAFYVFPDVSSTFGRTTASGAAIDGAGGFASALLEETGVAVVPGDDFLGCGPRHVRLSFALDEAAIDTGCVRIGQWLAELR